MPSWVPKSQILEDQIAEEHARAEALREKQWQPVSTMYQPPVSTEPIPAFAPPTGTFAPPIEQPQFAPFQQDTWQPSTQTDIWQPPVPESQMTMQTITAPAPSPIPTDVPEKALWEKPAQLYTQAEQAIGEAVSKIPVLPKVLSFAAPAFEWMRENIEKPWAAIITSPFAPSLSWQQGESWLDHQKRSYDAWEAPTYIKGAAEFSMPLWWMPWLGWATKGAKALGVGGKVARTLQAASTPEKIAIPASEVLDNMFKKDVGRAFAWWAENKPVMNKVVEVIGGKNAFIKAPFPEQTPLDITKRALGKYHIVADMRHDINGLLVPQLQKYGNYMKLLQIDDAGKLLGVTAKDGSSTYLSDLIEGFVRTPDNYIFTNPQAKAFVQDTVNVLNKVYDLASREGVKVPKDFIFHRMVEGKQLSSEAMAKMARDKGLTLEQLQAKLGEKVMEMSEYGSKFEVQRHYKTMAEGVANGVKYVNDPLRTVTATVENYVKKIATKRFDDEVKVLGKTPLEKFAEFAPDVAEKISDLTATQMAAKYGLQAVNRIFAYKGASVPGATIKKIRDTLPDIANQIDTVLTFAPNEADKVIRSLGREFYQSTKLNYNTVKIGMEQFVNVPDTILIENLIWKGNYEEALKFLTRDAATNYDVIRFINSKNYTEAIAALKDKATRIRLSDLESFVDSLNLSNEIKTRALANAYRTVYQSRKQFVNDSLRKTQNEVKGILESTRTELTPLKAIRSEFLRPYRGSTGQVLGKEESFWRNHPAFRGVVFDKNVVDYAEKILGDKGNAWVRDMGNVSGVSRTLVAALDFSAPFIQGLVVLGRNPVAWAKAVTKQFEFAINPVNFYKYMASPEVAKIAADRIYYGGSRSTFEFFQALAPLQRVAEKIPKVGGIAKKSIAETYGRAEAAFTGFGEVARNEMWKALRRPGMADAELQQLARSVDRMTGVMSTEALGISRTQRDFESAFMFFAPRYTRAGMTLVGDIFKGGLSGQQAQVALASMMTSGIAMYIGATKVLGQQPNLDLGSSRFMTIKIGESHVGVGGIFYGMARMAMNVIGTAAGDNPMDLVRLNRFDNPFIQFMFNRTSPLTGTVVNVMEGKDYFGQPFESAGDWGKFMLEKIIPISAQQALTEKGSSAPVYAASVFGARTFPKSAWELREETRDRHALEQFNQPYATLPNLQKRQIDQSPDILLLNDEADKITEQRGGLSARFLARQRERDDARFMFVENLNQAQRAYDAGLMDGVEFRERLQDASYGLGTTLEHIDRQPQYKDVMAKLKQPKDISNKYIGDVAYDELMNATYSNAFEDQYGIFNYDAYNKFREALRQKYGDAVYQYVLNLEVQKRGDLPPLAQEYYKTRDILRPYWQVADRVAKLFGQRFADSPAGQNLISKQRKIVRLSTPGVDAAYRKFYSQS